MSESGSPQLLEVARVGCTDEYLDHLTYKRLSDPRIAKNKRFSEILAGLSATEYRHYEFWRSHVPKYQAKKNQARASFIAILRGHYGLTLAVHHLDRNED